MAFCSNCGSKLPEGKKFCPDCGAPVEPFINAAAPGDEGKPQQTADQVSTNQAQERNAAQQTAASEKAVSGIDKYGKFFGIILLILAFLTGFTDPPILTIISSVIIIGACFFCFKKKYRLKGFTIAALILAIICLILSIFQAKHLGLFKIPGKSATSYKSSVVPGFDETTNQKVPLGTMTFSLPSYYVYSEKESSDKDGWKQMMYSHGRSDTKGALLYLVYYDMQDISYINITSDAIEGLFDEISETQMLENESGIVYSTIDHDSKTIRKRESTGTLNGHEADQTMYVIYNGEGLYLLLLYQLPSGSKLYQSDFEKIVQSGIDSDTANTNLKQLTSGSSSSSGAVPSAPAPSSSASGDSKANGVRPEVKEAIDSYEKFVDEYVAIMQRYMRNPADLSILSDYTSYMGRLAEMEKKFEAIEKMDMTQEESLYYAEVSLRCSQKMLNVLK